jgi:hypothetical protein
MTLVILPSALEDLAEGTAFYDNKQAGLGAYFLESLYSDIESLKLYAGIHRKVFGFHRQLSKRFPWAVYYSVEIDTVLVRAVLDCRNDPNSIKSKLER